MIQIRKAVLVDVPAIAQGHVRADWGISSALFGSQANVLELGESELWQCALRERRHTFGGM
jgi:hypothetical protein